MRHAATAAIAVLLAGTAVPASAQKSADTMRVGIKTELSQLSIYTFPHPEAGPFYKEIYDPLIRYDEKNVKFVPLIAKSWTRAADGSYYDFELRDDVKFHDGKKFTSDDVVETVKWAIDPSSKMLNPQRYTTWIKSAEALSPSKVRIYTLRPTAIDTMRLATALQMLDGDLLKSLPDKSQHGFKPIGTGPLKVVNFKAGEKVVLERFDDYTAGTKSPVKRVEGYTIPDPQTQVAQLITGGIDVVRDPPADLVKSLTQSNPNIKSTITPSLVTVYLGFDATNRSGQAQPITDVRVRRAVEMAIDRRTMATQFGAAGERTRTPDAMCLPEMVACKVTVKPPAYDPAGAKKLLAEAGYANGFEIEVVAVPEGREAAVALSGYLQQVGIKTRINNITTTVDYDLRPSGKNPLYVGVFPGQALADAHLFSQNFMERESMDYSRDAEMIKAGKEGLLELDPAKRDKIYEGLFNRMNEQAYFLNLLTLDTVYLHSKDVVVEPGRALNSFTQRLQDFAWAK